VPAPFSHDRSGARHFYISNLPLTRTSSTLNQILERAGALT
jgi:hypothetical protein